MRFPVETSVGSPALWWHARISSRSTKALPLIARDRQSRLERSRRWALAHAKVARKRVGRWPRYVPLIDVVREYRRDDLPHDLVAGCVLGVVTVPQAIAYAFLAGLPAQAGLYACLLPMVLYAVFGSSRQLVVGPVAVAALMVAAALGEHAPAYSNRYAEIATILCLQVGILLWLLRAFQMGGIVNLLSHPVISGFINAAAVVIIVSQLAAFTGVVPAGGGSAVEQATRLWEALPEADLKAVGIGLASLVVIWIVRHYGRFVGSWAGDSPIRRAGPMAVVLLATLCVAVFGIDVETVGHVPAGLPTLALPPLELALWWDLAPNAALIALVAYVESYSVGKTLASRRQRRVNSNQELIALGAANIGAAFTGAYPVAGSFSRSGVNFAAGARTPVSTLVCAVVVAVTVAWLTPLFRHLPHAALAAIVIVSVFGLFEFHSIRGHWKFYRADVFTHLITFAGVLLAGVEAGLLLGVVIAVMLFVRRSSQPHIAELGRLGDTPHFRNVERYEVQTWRHVKVLRVDESFYFANANKIESRLSRIVERQPRLEHMVLVCSAVNFIDTSGLEMLERLNFRLRRFNVRLHLCEVKGPVRDQLDTVGVTDWLSGKVYQTTDDALFELGARAAESGVG